ncbi:hypothetical protein RRM65_000758 [Aeromonas salmonicida subsp. salmonicida]|nr:hypothetical protein [Aeromonas salmonicida subsp. salmonicida]
MREIMTVDRTTELCGGDEVSPTSNDRRLRMSEIMTVDRTTELWDGDEAAFFPLLPVTTGG